MKSPFDILGEQIVNISKAGAFDIVSKHNQELTAENSRLKERVKYLEDLINEYTWKMLANLETDPVDDLPKTIFQSPAKNE